MWFYLIKQITEQPLLKLGGPSIRWVNSALKETFKLSKLPSPKFPVLLSWLKTSELLTRRVHNRMKVWPNGILHFIKSARHEVLMEDITTQKYVIQEIVSFLSL